MSYANLWMELEPNLSIQEVILDFFQLVLTVSDELISAVDSQWRGSLGVWNIGGFNSADLPMHTSGCQ